MIRLYTFVLQYLLSWHLVNPTNNTSGDWPGTPKRAPQRGILSRYRPFPLPRPPSCASSPMSQQELIQKLQAAGCNEDSAARAAVAIHGDEFTWGDLKRAYGRGGDAAVRADLQDVAISGGVVSKIITYLHQTTGSSSSIGSNEASSLSAPQRPSILV